MVLMRPAITSDLVIAAYRLILGREPESDAIVRSYLSFSDVAALRRAFLTSPEFLGLYEQLARQIPATRVPLTAPPLDVEVALDDARKAVLMGHVQEQWTRLGKEQPHWSVLSAEDFRPDRIKQNEHAFFESGAADLELLVATLRRSGLDPLSFRRIFEFGCGLGRVTAHFSQAFAEVHACDISTSHMEVARRRLEAAEAKNVTLHLSEVGTFGMHEGFDLWFCRIVLQHNPPPLIHMILRRAFSLLRPGGAALFQVPTYAIGYRFSADEYLQQMPQGIEMHVLPQSIVLGLAADAGLELLDVREDDAAGPPAGWVSNLFLFRKRATA